MELDYIEVEEVVDGVNGLQIYQQDKATINVQIATAKRYPRNLQRCIQNAITIVTLDKEIASSCTYSLPKGKTVTGPSVKLATILAQAMGNMRIENRVVGYDATHVTCEAVCFDLESNFAIRTQIRRSIVGKDGRFGEDLVTITGNAGNAIALRNAIFKVIPQSIINSVWNEAKKKITGDLSDETKLIRRRTLLIDGFKDRYAYLKITDEDIARTVGKSVVDHIDKDDIVTLLGYENSLATGEIKPETLFKGDKMYEKPADKSAERILKLIEAAKTKDALEKLFKDCSTIESKQAYDLKFKTFK